MLGSGSLLMKPSASPPNDAAPAAWVVARATPKPVAASGEALPGSIQRRIRHSSSTPSTSGTCTPPSALASASQRSPWASAAKKPAGGWAWVFMIAVVPSERRSLVAADVSPPASGAVATTAEPRRSSACLAMTGWRVMFLRVPAKAGPPRAKRRVGAVSWGAHGAGSGCWDGGSLRSGSCWSAETRTEQVRSTIDSTSSNPCSPP